MATPHLMPSSSKVAGRHTRFVSVAHIFDFNIGHVNLFSAETTNVVGKSTHFHRAYIEY